MHLKIGKFYHVIMKMGTLLQPGEPGGSINPHFLTNIYVLQAKSKINTIVVLNIISSVYEVSIL